MSLIIVLYHNECICFDCEIILMCGTTNFGPSYGITTIL